MKIYYQTRTQARNNKGSNKVVDCKDNKSVNGSRWAVEVKK